MIQQSYQSDVDAYVDDVLEERIPTGQLVRYAVQRYVEDIDQQKDKGIYLDVETGSYAINFFSCLKHTKGEFAGSPFIPEPFQKFILWNLWGWKRERDGLRRFFDAFISLARGNGKSPFGAGCGNLLFAGDSPPEPRSEVYCAATKREQAKIVFEEAKCQVDSVPGLRNVIERRTANMFMPSSGSKFEPLGSDSNNTDGLIIHGLIRDELHAWQERHRGLYEKLETAMAKRRQPLAITITTAGDDASEIWMEQYDFSVKVVSRGNGIEDDGHFSFIAEVDKEDDIFDEKNWPKANPMLLADPPPVKIDRLRSLARKAKIEPAIENTLRRYYLNQMTVSFFKFLSAELWKRGNKPLLEDHKNRPVFLGFDWGWKDDLASLGMVFPVQRDDSTSYDIKSISWIPEGCKRDLTREPWASWIKDGVLQVTAGATTDPEAIYATMDLVVKEHECRAVAYDPNNAREFGMRCANDWGLNAVEFTQSCRSYNEPTREFAKLLADGRMRHGGSPLLGWAADNVTVKENSAGYIMPCKHKSTDKIDPIVAEIMALSEAIFAEDDSEESIYETRGLRML